VPVKVGLIAPFFLPRIGGANRYCFELAKSLAEKGLEIHLFSVPGALSDPAYQLHPILSLNLAQDIRVLRSYKMDVCHALFFYYTPLALFAPNVFVTAHGDDGFSQQIRFDFPGRRALERQLLWRLSEAARRRVNCSAAILRFIKFRAKWRIGAGRVMKVLQRANVDDECRWAYSIFAHLPEASGILKLS
jgi:glycosyltransferase involved in cell wall biosynthesis